jgi:hypothetical protein
VYFSTDTVLDGRDDLACTALVRGGIAAGGSATQTIACSVPSVAAGTWVVGAWLDYADAEAELDETNNTALARDLFTHLGGGGSTSPTYTDYQGFEYFDYYFGTTPGDRNCELVWEASGTPITTCPGCEFTFEVDLTYDRRASYDDGTCASAGADATYDYGYTDDYYGYGPMLLVGYGSGFYAVAYADFDGVNFEYSIGYEDLDLRSYGYPGYWYTYLFSGEAVLSSGSTPPSYTSYEGEESFDYYFGKTLGDRNCDMVWEASGTPITTCPSCEFAFDVTLTYDPRASYDDGTCSSLAADASYDYGYTDDYYGYGPMLLLGYASSFYAWAYADFDGVNFEYSIGYLDLDISSYGYPGYWYTYYWQGQAEVL